MTAAPMLLPVRRFGRALRCSTCWVGWYWVGWYWVGCCWLVGCSNSSVPTPLAKTAAERPANAALDSSSTPATPRAAGRTAAELLEKMRSVYRAANAYADNASVVFYAVRRATGGEQETPYTRTSVAFERPNKLSVTYLKTVSDQEQEEYRVVSNGATVRAATNELADQIHETFSPLEFTSENFIPEPAMRGALLENSIENTLPQLALLFEKDKERPIFAGEQIAGEGNACESIAGEQNAGEQEPALLVDASLDGKPYHRIELESPAGKRVLWLDQDNFTLRRMEIPIDNQRPQINSNNQYSEFSVWIDFENVTIDPEIDAETFELAVPTGSRRVRRFIPPPPAGPPDSLGKPIGQYGFRTLDGEPLTPAALAGKVTVLEFWSTLCSPCQAQTPVLNQVYEHFKDSGEVAFYAVSTDGRAVTNEVVAETMASWGGNMPVGRDLDRSGYHALNVRQTPTLLLVDREGRLQVFQAGAHRRPEPLIDAIQRMVDGEDLVARDRQRHAEFVGQYEQALQAATIDGSIIEVELARPEVAPRKAPEHLQLQSLWKSSGEQLRRPGDVLVLAGESEAADRLLVLDGGEAIVEFDLAGKLVDRHELPTQDGRAGGFLRSWGNEQGERWYLVSGVGWQKVFLFNKDWELALAFPDEQHSGIGDVLLADLTNSGTPVMYVGYWGGLGVQGGTLDGRRLWSNRTLDHVLQIGVGLPADAGSKATGSGGNQTAWCTSTRGTLMRLRADGKPLEERYIAGQSLMYFASQPDGEQHCGLSIDKVGQYTAVGFDSQGSVAWEYSLPPGEYVQQLPRVQSVRLPGGDTTNRERGNRESGNRESGNGETGNGERGWLVAAANGSLHWLNVTGELVDRFATGDILTGVSMVSAGDQTQLFVATADNVSAWNLRLPPPVEKAARPADEAPPTTAPPTNGPPTTEPIATGPTSAAESAAEPSEPTEPELTGPATGESESPQAEEPTESEPTESTAS